MARLNRRQRRATRRETRELLYDVVEDFKDEGRELDKDAVKKEVLDRRERSQALFDGLDPEVKNKLRDLFLKLLDMFIDRLFSQLG